MKILCQIHQRIVYLIFLDSRLLLQIGNYFGILILQIIRNSIQSPLQTNSAIPLNIPQTPQPPIPQNLSLPTEQNLSLPINSGSSLPTEQPLSQTSLSTSTESIPQNLPLQTQQNLTNPTEFVCPLNPAIYPSLSNSKILNLLLNQNRLLSIHHNLVINI